MDQNMEEIQKQLKAIQKAINEKWEKKYLEFDSITVKLKEPVGNNSEQINGICKGLREQGNKLINVEAKISQDREEYFRRIEKETRKFHPSTNEYPKMFLQELQSYLVVVKSILGISMTKQWKMLLSERRNRIV
ncbi:hypothetical protein FQA39_LY11476 [Lamprigera yunnana]|nr:hypothetical protein FQA39_LY11476 [Lamprigera yunnana]